MAFNAGELIAKFKIDSKGATRGLKKTEAQVGKTQKKFAALGTAVKAAIGVAAVAGARQLGTELFRAADAGARLAAQMDTFSRMTSAQGVSDEGLIRQVQDITGAISRKRIASTANQLELLGVGLRNTPRFTEIARSAAIGLGKDIGFMLESLSTGTARQSRLWLDNLGIIISVEKANKKYAETLGKTASQLTDNEKRTAFLNEVLIRGQDIIDKVGAKGETNAEKIGKLSAAWEDLNDQGKIFLGWALADPFGELGEGLQKLNRNIAESRTPFERLKSLLAFVSGGAARATFGMVGVQGAQNRVNPNPFNIKITGPQATGGGGSGGRAAQVDMLALAFEKGLRKAQIAQAIRESAASAGGARFPGGQAPTGIQSPDAFPGAVNAPELLNIMPPIVAEFNLANDAVNALGTSVSFMFENMVTGAMSAGRAFATAITAGISSVAENMGNLFLQTGLGTLALGAMNPFAMIAAGLALKAIGGVFSGISSNQSFTPAFSRGQTRGANREDFRSGNLTVIVQGDMVGEDMWMDRLINRLNRFQRSSGAQLEVVT